MEAGCLYVVATPIGNLEDMTARAVRVLRDVDAIAAEDTRHSRRLLDHYGISTPVTSYHEHNEEAKAAALVESICQGRRVALISDAGTPCVSDPGYRIVRAAREAGLHVIAVPGASAVVAALSICGLPSQPFTFHGFFPRKAGQAADALTLVAAAGGTHCWYESPNRIARTLDRLADALPEAEVCVARELTKVHEEVVWGSALDVARQFGDREVRGECVIVLHAAREASPAPDDDAIREAVEHAMDECNLSRRDAVRRVAEELGLPRNRVYQAALEEA